MIASIKRVYLFCICIYQGLAIFKWGIWFKRRYILFPGLNIVMLEVIGLLQVLIPDIFVEEVAPNRARS